MKIAFMGKGGSGKTTFSTAFTKYLLQKNDKKIFLFDVDLNSHLLESFSIKRNEINFMLDKYAEIFDILEPNFLQRFPKILQIPSFGTIPANEKTNFIFPEKTHEFVEKFSLQKGNLYLFSLGTYTEKETIDSACYHGLLNAFELVIHRIIDDENSFIISDSTAGIDNLGTSLFSAYDVTFFVIEPTNKSISVYEEYLSKLSEDLQEKVFVIANKITSEKDLEFIYSKISKEKIISEFNFDKEIYREDSENSVEKFILENEKSFEKMLQIIEKTEKNWEKYYKKIYELFKKETESWCNESYKVNFSEIIPENYEFLKLIIKKGE